MPGPKQPQSMFRPLMRAQVINPMKPAIITAEMVAETRNHALRLTLPGLLPSVIVFPLSR